MSQIFLFERKKIKIKTKNVIFWILEQTKKTRTRFVRLRKKERTEDALALIGDEGRDEQRNATGSSKYAEIRRCPNGGTH